jgi:nucleoside-diphosphate-sugar epimerase
VKDFLNKINLISNFKSKWHLKTSSFYESKILKLNNNKSKKHLGWRPILSINEMINFTISWYELLRKNKSQLHDLSISQIKYFIKKI